MAGGNHKWSATKCSFLPLYRLNLFNTLFCVLFLFYLPLGRMSLWLSTSDILIELPDCRDGAER